MQVQEAQRIPKKINPNRPTPTYYNKNGKEIFYESSCNSNW